ncbi:MAG: ABC-2 family transporter protein [Methanocella sp. PtaU1.Bin125]|nr:MAG: ABC-2 family transporter protein [Methanocella sp. PtaU1.Bin125]
MRPELIVASKEFRDYLASKRFLLLFGLLALLSIIGAVSGIAEYNSDLETYNSNLQQAAASVGGMRFFVDMPSILQIFSSYGSYIATFGMLLALSMGFDMISREKEEGTLKILLTHPVFRDQVINGKIIGAVAMMVIVLLSTFLAIVAIMLFFGIVPAGDDIVRLGAFFGAVVLFLTAYLAIAVMASTISKNSSMAMLIAIAIVLVGMVIPNISETVADTVLGPAPEMTVISAGNTTTVGGVTQSQFIAFDASNRTQGGPPMQINQEYTDYYNKRNQITGLLNILSPSQDFTAISEVINGRLSSVGSIGAGGERGMFQRISGQTVSVWQSLSSVWMNFLALIVMIVVGFGVSYARFVRVDVR